MLASIGRSLRGLRAGPQFRVAADLRFSAAPHTIAMRSGAFENGGRLPDGGDSPPLAWDGVPEGTAMLALVVEDVDVPLPRPLVHAVAYDVDPATRALEAGALESTRIPMGVNAMGRRAYIPPSPIPGHGVHRYVFTLLAAEYVPRFDQPPTRGRLLDALAGHVLALGELIGTKER